MKALSIMQPYATLVATGAKRYETRSRNCAHRGPFAIHASAGWKRDQATTAARSLFAARLEAAGFSSDRTAHDGLVPMPLGGVIAMARLTCVRHTRDFFVYAPRENQHEEYAFGDWTPGRFAYELADVVMLPEAVPASGQLGLWKLTDDVVDEITWRFGDLVGGFFGEQGPGRCRICGCTDEEACDGGCVWVEADLCSRCVERMRKVA